METWDEGWVTEDEGRVTKDERSGYRIGCIHPFAELFADRGSLVIRHWSLIPFS
ncbi:MAG: hypothetical protein GTO18_14170 [Anaerolineales bacterium]|nr:hypothetical protein [Anaerolineales bacterium]